jgi:hypothetical protein
MTVAANRNGPYSTDAPRRKTQRPGAQHIFYAAMH